MTGSRSGGIIASAWATLMLLGEDGYTRIAGECWQAFVGFRDGINAIPGFRVIGDPDAACIAFKCTDGPENKVFFFFFFFFFFINDLGGKSVIKSQAP